MSMDKSRSLAERLFTSLPVGTASQKTIRIFNFLLFKFIDTNFELATVLSMIPSLAITDH